MGLTLVPTHVDLIEPPKLLPELKIVKEFRGDSLTDGRISDEHT